LADDLATDRSAPGERLLPFDRRRLRADAFAGLIAAAVVIPKAMAFATIAGLPIEVGLYTSLVPMVIYAVLGTSRPLSVSTTTTIAILSAAALGEAASDASTTELALASATLAIIVGAMLVLASVLRLGFVANFISEPVLTGFKSGIGLVIVVDQVPKLLGIHIDKAGFLRDIVAIAEHVPQTSLLTLALSVSVLVLIFGLERFAPRAPAPLIAVAAGIAVCGLLDLTNAGITTAGSVPRGLPSWVWPQLGLVAQLWPGAVGIALMSFTESIAAGRAFASPDEPQPRANRELFALGLANVGGGLFGCMPAGGGTTQTAVNRSAGARTQFAELVTAGAALATLLLLAPLIALMPNAVLAAVVIVYSVPLIKPEEFRAIARVRRTEFYWALVACLGVVLLGTLRGIIVAVIVSLLALAQQAGNPPLYVLGRKPGTLVFRDKSAHPHDETWPGLLLLRPAGRIFFANAERLADKIRAQIQVAKPRVVVLDCRAVIDLEYTALMMLEAAEQKMRHEGTELWLTALNPNVLEVVQRSALGAALGRERMFFKLQTAVETYERSRAAEGASRAP